MGDILQFPNTPRLQRLAANLWIMRIEDTPESQARADQLIEQLRAAAWMARERDSEGAPPCA